MIAQGQKMITQNEKVIRQTWIAVGISVFALIASLVALFRSH
jgi:hypothetical protein